MKQVCLQCERSSPDKNLFCQESYCPAEISPTILEPGEWFGDIEIVRQVIVLRSAALYEVRHQKQKAYLKVAHPGDANKERLKREAELLRALSLRRNAPPTLPALLPAYANTTVARDPYGKGMLREHLLYFLLFAYVPAEPLRDVLSRNPQLWINHVGWITCSLAATLNFMHWQGRLHCALSPDSLLVHFDDNPPAPRIVLFDFGVASERAHLMDDWSPWFVLPGYTAPEMVVGQQRFEAVSFRTDVYGLGLTLYEMLVGKPAFSSRLNGDREIYEAIRENDRVKMNRLDDVAQVAHIALQSVSADPEDRPATASEIANQLIKLFGPVPRVKQSRVPSVNTILLIVSALLATTFLIALAVALSTPKP